MCGAMRVAVVVLYVVAVTYAWVVSHAVSVHVVSVPVVAHACDAEMP